MRRDIVVIGGSAGALDPLKLIVAQLPAELPAAVVVVLHLAATAHSTLVTILNRAGGMQAVVPRDGDEVRAGYIYAPVPDHHTELHDSVIRLTRGPRVNGMRPAIDVLFRSAANAYRDRVVGVVLSGGLDDGSAGLAAIRAAGGVGIVQSPEDALIDSMPRHAIAVARPDHVVSAERIGSRVIHSLHEEEGAGREIKETGGIEMEPVGAGDEPGTVNGLTCPDCSGSIWVQTGAGGDVALTCRVGHSYSPDTFFEKQAENVENALWAGVRALEEQASLATVMASRSMKIDDPDAASRYQRRRDLANENADVLRNLVQDGPDEA